MILEDKILINSNTSSITNSIYEENELTIIEKEQNVEHSPKKISHKKNSNQILTDKIDFMQSVEKVYIKSQIPKMQIGDLVKIGVYIKEGNKDRVQYYQGLIIGKNGTNLNLTITVRKVFQGIGVERKFLIHSPKFESIKIIKSSRVRRSKLYYLRNFSEKGSRLKPRFGK